MKTRARSSAKDKLVSLTPKGNVDKVRRRALVLEDSEISGEEPSQDQEPQPRTRNAAASSPTKPTPKGTMMEVGTGKRLRSKGTAGPATADKPAEAQPAAEEEQGHQQPEAAVKRKRGRPPGSLNKRAASKAAERPVVPHAEQAEASLQGFTKEQHEKRKRAEDALVREAERSGRFVDLAVHSFNAALPPSRLIVPEGVSVNFVRRQIQYRVEEHGGDLSADAIELQLKDSYRQMVTAASFNSLGREMTISDYGLVPGSPGAQHHIWAIFVDDSAARIQRAATARILQPTGASNVARSPPPPSVVAYEAALSPTRGALAAPLAAASPLREQARQEAAVRRDQEMQDAPAASPSPSRKRKPHNTRWSPEETQLLIDSVVVRGTGSWADILAQHRATFHPTRSSVDLKDKWRNLVKAAQKPAEAETRTQFLTREQVVKILEFLHQGDE